MARSEIARMTTEFKEHAIKEHEDAYDTEHLHHDQSVDSLYEEC